MRKVLAICGSTKQHSSSLSILKYIAENFQNNFHLEIYEALAALPHFNPDLDNEDRLPAEVRTLRQKIQEADGVLFSTPEYVFSMPSSLKNALEWNVSTVNFSSKPTAMIVAAASGKKAFESLALVLTSIEAVLPEQSRLLIGGAKGKIGKGGAILNEETKAQIHTTVQSFIDTMNVERKPTKYE